MPPVAADSPLGAATLALIAHERAGSADEMHPVLEQAFQYRQLDRAKVVIAAAGPILIRDLLANAQSVLASADQSEDEPEVTLVATAEINALRAAVAKAVA